MGIDLVPDWMMELEDEDITFIKRFILNSGSLKEMAKEYDVTYPTVRLRLDKLIDKIKINNDEETDEYIRVIKRLTINDQLDINTAKVLIKEYRKRRDK